MCLLFGGGIHKMKNDEVTKLQEDLIEIIKKISNNDILIYLKSFISIINDKWGS